MKILLTIFLALFSPLAVLAAVSSVSISTATVQLDISSVTRSLTVSGTNAESITVNQANGTLSMDLATGGTSDINISSAAKLKMSANVTHTFSCQDSTSQLTIQRGSEQAAVTAIITVSGSECSSGDNTGGGGGGGGGAGGITALTPAPAPAPAPKPAVTTASLQAQLAALQAQLAAAAPAVSPVFNSDLQRGSRNDDVKRLQQLLGVEATGYYGPLTEKSVKEFQAKNGLPQVGRVGPATRAKLNEVFGKAEPKAPEVAQPSPVAQVVSPVFNSDIQRGARNDDVKRLQQLLGVDQTGFYGSLTEKAVKEFQAKNGLPSVGRVGPATRAKLQEVFGK